MTATALLEYLNPMPNSKWLKGNPAKTGAAGPLAMPC